MFESILTKHSGPTTRIHPIEIHISDPDVYDLIYSSTAFFDKIEAFK